MRDKIIFKDFQNIVPMVKDRWTPIYLELGRLEVDNYSLKFINKNQEIIIPVAMVSCIILGPGTTVTHAAIVTCSKTNTPIIWSGEDGLYYYSTGVNVNESCKTSIRHAQLFSNPDTKLEIAKKMYKLRFIGINVDNSNLFTLMGLEGNRVKDSYIAIAKKYNIEWCGRNANAQYNIEIDDLNISLNILNYNLYCICLSVITTMGYIPSLGFIHVDGRIPFVYDIADLYKEEFCIDVAFNTYSITNTLNKEVLMKNFSNKVAEFNLLERIPKDLKELIK